MRTRWALAVLLLFAWLAPAVAAPAPRPKKSKEETCTVEIDFSPLAPVAEDATYKLRITARSESGETYQDTFETDGVPLPSVIRAVSRSFGWSGWDVKLDGHKLVVEGHKGSPIVKFDLKAEGLPEANIPKVKRLPRGGKKAPGK
jgi:hypothetical protein